MWPPLSALPTLLLDLSRAYFTNPVARLLCHYLPILAVIILPIFTIIKFWLEIFIMAGHNITADRIPIIMAGHNTMAVTV